MSALRGGPYGLFLSVQLLGLMAHFEVYNARLERDTVLLGLCISWRHQPIAFARISRHGLLKGWWLWLECWGRHRMWFPGSRRGQVGERA